MKLYARNFILRMNSRRIITIGAVIDHVYSLGMLNGCIVKHLKNNWSQSFTSRGEARLNYKTNVERHIKLSMQDANQR